MASITIEKHTSISTKAQGRHNYRENKNNSNQHIDPSKTHLNINLDSRYKNSNELQTAIKERVKEVDADLPPQRKKKDRVVSVCIEIPSPRKDMTYEDSVKFLKAANEALNEKFGIENCHGAMIHADEQHNYINPSNKEIVESRIHLHKMVVPFVEGKGINGKQFVPRTFFNEINHLLDEVCVRELGYTFRDGTRQKSRGRVEDIKADSAIITAQLNKQLKKQNENLQKQNEELTEKCNELSAGIETGMKELQTVEKQYYQTSEKLKEVNDVEKLCRIANLDDEIEKKASELVYQILGNKIQQDNQINEFFKAKGLWGQFRLFCRELISKAKNTTKELTINDDYER